MSKKNFENEEWRPVKDYEEFYAVSSLGRIKSLERTVVRKDGRKRRLKEKILKPQPVGIKGHEHLRIKLCKNGTYRPYQVHVLVALSFPEICGLPFEGAEVNHIDENPLNNRADNINWLSHGDNLRWGTVQKRKSNKRKGVNYREPKTVYQYTKDTHELVREWQSTNEVHRQTGWCQSSISLCCNGIYKSAHGYLWSYTPLTL